MDDEIKKIIDAMFCINNKITKGVTFPLGNDATGNIALPNYQDPRFTLKFPSHSVNQPKVQFSLGLDIDWQKVLGL